MNRIVAYWKSLYVYVSTHVVVPFSTSNQYVAHFLAAVSAWWNRSASVRSLTLLVIFVPASLYIYAVLYVPPAGDKPVYITISDSVPLAETLASLEDARVIVSAFWLKVLLKVTHTETKVFAGEYYFAQPTHLLGVFRRVTSGSFGISAVRFTVREGDTVEVIADRCARLLIRCSKDSFIRLAASKEGYLFPDTYFVPVNITEKDLVTLLEEALYKKIEPYSAAISLSEFSLHELLTLASIIEKEEHEDADRKMISGVLRNRLAIGMPLQVDAAFLYIMGKGSAQLSRDDLAHDSPYNTYVYKGLPPGPIGSPSLSSILAALFPTKNDALFYLADRYGTTYYSKTYPEHLAKKRTHIDSQR